MFAREQKNEYDPASSPKLERPLGAARPLSAQESKSGTETSSAMHSFERDPQKAFQSPSKLAGRASMPTSISKDIYSPTKSSLSSKSRYGPVQAFDLDSGIWSDDEDSVVERQLPPGKSLHRHAKSVTFDVAPPQVNEYEQATPDPSSVASGSREGSHDSYDDDESFDRGSSINRDDSFDASLEDTDKTPVVLPEDWRFMSPDTANEELTARFEDPFDGTRCSPAPTARPSSAVDARASPTRTESADSSGERRPLPPLPPSMAANASHARSDSKHSLSMAERVDHSQRQASSPPRPASVSKSDIQGMSGCSMTLEERLHLMMLDDDGKGKSAAEEQRERKLRRGSPARNEASQVARHSSEAEDKDDMDDFAELNEYRLPPRISRESILRNVRDRAKQEKVKETSPLAELSTGLSKDLSNIDPDVPLPSTEKADSNGAQVKQELEDSEADIYAIPDLYHQHVQAESFANAMEKLEAIKKAQETDQHQISATLRDEDEDSQYSVDDRFDLPSSKSHLRVADAAGPPTPKATAIGIDKTDLDRKSGHRMSLPQFAALLGENDFDFGMDSFITDANTLPAEQTTPEFTYASVGDAAKLKDFAQPRVEFQRPKTPEGRNSFEEPGTPESVVKHPIGDSPHPESPGIPEPAATVKASSGKLKIRQSATPADLQAMAEVRRQVSGETPPVPAIPAQRLSHPESRPGSSNSMSVAEFNRNIAHADSIAGDARQSKRKSSLTPLDLQVGRGDGLGIESEFDRLMEAQKVEYPSRNGHSHKISWSPGISDGVPVKERGANGAFRTQKGYLMRQNTKVIVASSASHETVEANAEAPDDATMGIRGTRSAGNSPRKASSTQTWTTEPWNGKIRRKSIRKSGGIPSKAPMGHAPPLPGQQSNVTSGLDSVDENEITEDVEEIGEDGERGRLFVKVVRVKELDLPLPRGKYIKSQ